VNERLNTFAPRTVLEHTELAHSLMQETNGTGQISYQMQVFLESMKKQLLDFTAKMESPEFKARVESDIEEERRRKTDLQKREKQLQAQIDNLIKESLGLLKSRLGELGIKAKNSPEFIEKAKGIVCSHHELQRRRSGLEAEIRQLEAESDRLVKDREQEVAARIAREKPGLSSETLKALVKREMDALLGSVLTPPPAMRYQSTQYNSSPPGGGGHVRHRQMMPSAPPASASSSSAPEPKVAPLLNRLSDVTFTKCGPGGERVNSNSTSHALLVGGGAELITTQVVRKRNRVGETGGQKQRDWPEKRTKLSNDWPSKPASAEEHSPDKRIIEQSVGAGGMPSPSRLMEAERRTTAATLTVSPSKANSNIYPPPQQQQLTAVEVRKVEAESLPFGKRSSTVADARPLPSSSGLAADLPRVDLSASLQAASSSSAAVASGVQQHMQQQSQTQVRS